MKFLLGVRITLGLVGMYVGSRVIRVSELGRGCDTSSRDEGGPFAWSHVHQPPSRELLMMLCAVAATGERAAHRHALLHAAAPRLAGAPLSFCMSHLQSQ